MRRNLELKLPPDTSSQICCHTALRGVVSTVQHYSEVNSNQTGVKMCNCSKCPRWMIILVRLGGLIYNMCSKRSPSARMHILRRARHWSIDALTVRYSMPYQTFVKCCRKSYSLSMATMVRDIATCLWVNKLQESMLSWNSSLDTLTVEHYFAFCVIASLVTFWRRLTWLALHICITLSCIASIYAQPHTYAKYQNLSKFIARPTSAKQVMFSPVFVCLSVNRIIQKLLIKSLCFANGWT